MCVSLHQMGVSYLLLSSHFSLPGLPQGLLSQQPGQWPVVVVAGSSTLRTSPATGYCTAARTPRTLPLLLLLLLPSARPPSLLPEKRTQYPQLVSWSWREVPGLSQPQVKKSGTLEEILRKLETSTEDPTRHGEPWCQP